MHYSAYLCKPKMHKTLGCVRQCGLNPLKNGKILVQERAGVQGLNFMRKTEANDIAAADREEDRFLMGLAERVRAARARRGMTRKILSRDSGVSERYLAQLEGGQGNASVLVLRRIAQAVGLPLEALISDSGERTVDEQLIHAALKRLKPAELAEVRALIDQRFTGDAGDDRAGRISLVGLRGAGKTTLGRRLAAHLGVPFVELNRLIEEEYGAPINEILELSGQATYRRYERRALERVVAEYPRVVIGTGGGLVTEPATLDYLLKHTLTIWLTATPQEHMARVIAQGDMRPMADNKEAMEDLKRILKAREPYYRQAALTLSTAGKTEDEALRDLIALIPAT